jgi:hypothetical protein
MEIICTHIAVPWDYGIPCFYGLYKGKLKDGNECTIDVDYKIKVFNEYGEQIGTDTIAYWLCDVNHVKALIDVFEKYK